MRSKRRLRHITIAAIFVLTSIFIGVHSVGVKDSYTHTQLVTNQRQLRKYSQIMPGRDGGKIYQVMEPLSSKVGKDQRTQPNFITGQNNSELLSSASPRGPPEQS